MQVLTRPTTEESVGVFSKPTMRSRYRRLKIKNPQPKLNAAPHEFLCCCGYLPFAGSEEPAKVVCLSRSSILNPGSITHLTSKFTMTRL